MEINILNFSTYSSIYDVVLEPLIGTQSIYSCNLQEILIPVFLQDKPVFRIQNEDQIFKFCFSINNLIFHPTITCSKCPNDLIVISDEMFEQYFNDGSPTSFELNFYYDLAKIESIKLKRIDGNFPRDDSLEFLLTNYFEKCMVVNKGQQFKIQYSFDDFISFEITQITFIEVPERNLENRLEEINLTVNLNHMYTQNSNLGLQDCRTTITNFKWYYNTKGNGNKDFGDVSFQNINVDFEESEIKPIVTEPSKKEIIEEDTSVKDEPKEPELTREEIRQKRLAFYKTFKP